MDGDAGRHLRLDAEAASTNPGLPGFIARPEDAPVYHGFSVLEDVTEAGFVLGMITDWEAEPSTQGDAFVIAPDGSRCGLVWEFQFDRHFEQVLEVTPDRWGVWSVGFPYQMDSRESARRNLAHVLTDLRPVWEEWVGRSTR